jgi:hypothetical protein
MEILQSPVTFFHDYHGGGGMIQLEHDRIVYRVFLLFSHVNEHKRKKPHKQKIGQNI